MTMSEKTPAPVGAAVALDLDAIEARFAEATADEVIYELWPALVAEVRRLTRWQSEAMPVMAGLQGLGSALGMRLGESITGHAAAEAARALTARAEAAEAEVVTLRALLDGDEKPPMDRTAAEYLAWAVPHWRKRARAAEARLAAVEALATKFEGWPSGPSYAVTAKAIRAALATGDLPPADPDAEAVEKMAEAMYKDVYTGPSAQWGGEVDHIRDVWRSRARAALAALREHEPRA